MKNEKEIETRLKELWDIREKIADILTHGYPEFITTYESALKWVLK